jgi:cytochrome c
MNENLLQLGFLALLVVGFILARLLRYAPSWERSWSGVGRNSAFWLGSSIGGLAVAAVMLGALQGAGVSASGTGGRGVEAAAIPSGPGRDLFSAKTCNTCHTVAGLSTGTVGPELTHVGSHAQIAGTAPMSRENLVKWIMDPPAVKPGTTMPKLGVSEADASTLADWLLQLK